MAFIINPDGTITMVEANYDRNGNLKPKIDSTVLNEQVISYNPNTESSTNRQKVASSAPKRKRTVARAIPPSRQKLFISKAEIDLFFKDRICSRKRISNEEYSKILLSLSGELRDYFVSRFLRYKGFRPSMDEDFRDRKTFKKTKNKKKAAKKKKEPHVIKQSDRSISIRTGFSIGEIATFSSANKRTPDGDMVNGRSLLGASRKPKYGYARDRYGRVQERDIYNEERRNEFHTAQKHQRNYDYSSYDANDDHDGAYNGWE